MTAAAPWKAGILIASDKGARGERADETGPALEKALAEAGYGVAFVRVLPDEEALLAGAMRECCDGGGIALLLTAGGTGFSPRDRTPEATLAVADRLAPGLAEAMRAESLAVTRRAMLSRGVAAIRGGTLILNLPGSPRGACENLAVVLPVLGHALETLRGGGGECARRSNAPEQGESPHA